MTTKTFGISRICALLVLCIGMTGCNQVTVDTVLTWTTSLLPIAMNLAADTALLSGNQAAAAAAQKFNAQAQAITAEIRADVAAYKANPSPTLLIPIGAVLNTLNGDMSTLITALNLPPNVSNAITIDVSFAMVAITSAIAAYNIVNPPSPAVTLKAPSLEVQKSLKSGINQFKKDYAKAHPGGQH